MFVIPRILRFAGHVDSRFHFSRQVDFATTGAPALADREPGHRRVPDGRAHRSATALEIQAIAVLSCRDDATGLGSRNLTAGEAVCIVPSRGVVGLNVKTQALATPKEVALERQIPNARCSWYWCLDLFASAIRTPRQCGIRYREKRYSQGDRYPVGLGLSSLHASARSNR